MDSSGQSEQLRAFFRSGSKRQYHKNETILRTGAEPAGIYFIESGLIKIFVNDKNGVEHITHFFGDGDFFPLVWFFRPTAQTRNYQTLEPTVVWVVSTEKFREFIFGSKDILYEMVEEMVDRYIRYRGRIENLLYSGARERTAYRLLSLANRFGQPVDGAMVIKASITQEDLARSLNMTRETLGRCLSRFASRGFIAYDGDHHIILKDLGALVKIIGHYETETTWPELMKYIID